MIVQYVLAAFLCALIAAFVIRLNIAGRAEHKRRAGLPIAERQRLENEDALWQQSYDF